MTWPVVGDVQNIEIRGVIPEAAELLRQALEWDRGEWRSSNTWEYLGFLYLATVQEGDNLLCALEKIARIDVDDEGREVLVDLTVAKMETTYPGAW